MLLPNLLASPLESIGDLVQTGPREQGNGHHHDASHNNSGF
jgi:hypothetical protein